MFIWLCDGDLDLYRMHAGGTGVRRLTHQRGYDGGPFFAWDGRFIVYHVYHPHTTGKRQEYEAVLAQHLVKQPEATAIMALTMVEART